MSQSFKDLFSSQAIDYAKFRPTYPTVLFDHLASLARGKTAAWDCGTGNGQAAVELAKRFDKVYATDPSESQIQNAIQRPNITYSVASAEDSKLPSGSVDLITAAQAFHWFNHEEFFVEVKRVAKPGAILAVWAYSLANINKDLNIAVNALYTDLLGDYWEPERKLAEEGYRSIVVPFQEISLPKIDMDAEWTLDQFLGYLQTWSAYQNFIKKNGAAPAVPYLEKIANTWRASESTVKTIRWPLATRVFKI